MCPIVSFSLAMLLSSGVARTATLTVNLPEGTKAISAVAIAADSKTEVKAAVDGGVLSFLNLLPETAYDLRVILSDGTICQGVDLSWYAPQQPSRDPEPMDEDDLQQIRQLFDSIKAFENRRNLLHLRGNHDQAVVLAELIRDTPFHSDTGGQVIWRVEIWYFQNQHGGWERIAQASRVLRRERFASAREYRAATDRLRWIPSLGGIRLGKEEHRTIRLSMEDLGGVRATAP